MSILNKFSILEVKGKQAKNIPVCDLFVSLQNVGAVALNKLSYGEDKTILSYNDYLDCKKNKTAIKYKDVDGNVCAVNPKSKIYRAKLFTPTYIITGEYGPSGRLNSNQQQARIYTVEKNYDYANDFVYVRLDLETSFKLIHKEHLGYYIGTHFVSLKDLEINGDIKHFEDFEKNKNINVTENLCLDASLGSKPVAELYTGATFKIGELAKDMKYAENLDLENLQVETYSLNEFNNEIKGPEIKHINKIIVEQRLVKKADVNYIASKQYKLNKNGMFIKVKFLQDNIESLINIDDIDGYYNGTKFCADTSHDKNFMQTIVGKALHVKGHELLTEPLKNSSSVIRYSEVDTMCVTDEYDDILNNGTYILLADGRFVEERYAIRPKAYEYCLEQDSTAYFVKSANINYVVDKTKFGKHFVLPNGNSVVWTEKYVTPIKETTKDLLKCDIIQTTNKKVTRFGRTVFAQQAVQVNLSDNGAVVLTPTKERENIIASAYKEFIDRYIAGTYEIENVVVDKMLVPVDNRHLRFRNVDIAYSVDTAKEYLTNGVCLADSGKGGPKFAFKKACKKKVRELFNYIKRTWKVFLELPGWFACVAVAPFALATFVCFVGGVIAIPIANIYKEFKQQSRSIRVKNKSSYKAQNDANELTIKIKQLVDVLNRDEAFSNNGENTNLTMAKVLKAFDELENLANQNANGKFVAEFNLDAGCAIVGEYNAQQYTNYLKEKESLDEFIASIKKSKNWQTKQLCEIMQQKKNYISNCYVSSGVDIFMLPEIEEKYELIKRLKGFVLAKKFKEDLGINLSKDETAIFELLKLKDILKWNVQKIIKRAEFKNLFLESNNLEESLNNLNKLFVNLETDNYIVLDVDNVPKFINLNEVIEIEKSGYANQYSEIDDDDEFINAKKVIDNITNSGATTVSDVALHINDLTHDLGNIVEMIAANVKLKQIVENLENEYQKKARLVLDLKKQSDEKLVKLREVNIKLQDVERTSGLMPENSAVTQLLIEEQQNNFKIIKGHYDEDNKRYLKELQLLDLISKDIESKLPIGCNSSTDIERLIADAETRKLEIEMELENLKMRQKKLTTLF